MRHVEYQSRQTSEITLAMLDKFLKLFPTERGVNNGIESQEKATEQGAALFCTKSVELGQVSNDILAWSSQ